MGEKAWLLLFFGWMIALPAVCAWVEGRWGERMAWVMAAAGFIAPFGVLVWLAP